MYVCVCVSVCARVIVHMCVHSPGYVRGFDESMVSSGGENLWGERERGREGEGDGDGEEKRVREKGG